MDNLEAVVIEADPALALLISTVLREDGFTIQLATTGPAGVEAVQKSTPSMVTTDLFLPGFDGHEVIRRIRLFSDVPLLILCGSNDLVDLQSGLGAGADSYLAKPFSANVLQAYIRALQRRPAWLSR